MRASRHVIAHMLLVEHASAEAVASLRREGIRSILIKGPLQQRWLEAAGPSRASVDVDLLLDPADIAAATAVMAKIGYRTESEVTPGVGHHATPLTAPRRVPVELHWTLWGTNPDRTWDVMANETEVAELEGETVDVPNEGARCLLAALHAAHHGTGEEAPRHDLGRAIAVADRAAWQRASELARAVDGEHAFVAGLELLPEGARLRADLGLQPLPLTERLVLNIDSARVPGAPGFYWLARQRGTRAKASFVMHKLFPPPAFMRFKYPYARRGTAHLALAYLYRPLWMARWAVPGFLAWRRARVAARTSSSEPDRG